MRWSTPDHGAQSISAAHLPIEVVGEADTGRETLAQVEALHPNVVVMDLQPHPASAPELMRDNLATIQMIKSRRPAIRIVVLTMYATERAAVLSAGADAFLLKGCTTKELLDAVMKE